MTKYREIAETITLGHKRDWVLFIEGKELILRNKTYKEAQAWVTRYVPECKWEEK